MKKNGIAPKVPPTLDHGLHHPGGGALGQVGSVFVAGAPAPLIDRFEKAKAAEATVEEHRKALNRLPEAERSNYPSPERLIDGIVSQYGQSGMDSVLYRLLHDQRMEKVWRRLRKNIPTEDKLTLFITDVLVAYDTYASNKNWRPPTREKLKKGQKKIKEKAIELLAAIEATQWRDRALVEAVKKIQRLAETRALAFSTANLEPDPKVIGPTSDHYKQLSAAIQGWSALDKEFQKADALALRLNDPEFFIQPVQRSGSNTPHLAHAREHTPNCLRVFIYQVSHAMQRDLGIASDATLAGLASVVLSFGDGQEVTAEQVKNALKKSREYDRRNLMP